MKSLYNGVAKLALSLTLLLIINLVLLSTLSASEKSQNTMQIQQGSVDLSSFDFSASTFDLDGEWQFSPGLLNPGQKISTFAQVPLGMRFGTKGFDPHGTVYGSGTYRLELTLAEKGEALALSFPYIGIASKIFLNGVLVKQQGVPSELAGAEKPGYKPQVVELPGQTSKVELLVQFSNWSDVIAGISYPIKIGSSRSIMARHEASLLIDALVFGALTLMGIYHFGFFIFRTKDLAPLFFGLLCLVVAIRTTCVNELILLNIFPNLDWLVFMRIYYTMTYIAPVVFLGFVQALFPNKGGKWAFLVSSLLNFVYILLVWLSPALVFTQGIQIMNILLMASGIFGFGSVVKAALARKEGALMFIVGTAILFATVLNDILRIYYLIPSPNLVPWGILVFLLAQALLLTRIFTRAYNLAENYSQHLLELNTSLERFIPREVLQFLKKESILDIRLGDYSEEEMTVLFLDIRNFTALSETMAPRQNFDFINSFLRRFGPIVRENKGFIDKYVGDGIMALFPGKPHNAIQAALAMRGELKVFNHERQLKNEEPIAFGVGIHYGQLMIGTIGENFRMDSTVISDTVNVASRLENLTKQYKVDILLSGFTVDALDLEDRKRTVRLADETLRGKTQAIPIYTLNN